MIFCRFMKALLVVDYQTEWRNPESEYYAGDFSNQLEKTNRLIDHCRAKGYKIIFILHNDEGFDSEIIPEMHKEDSDVVIVKNKISPFYQTELEKELEGVDEVVIVGILTNMCVRSAIQDAYDRDFKITVVEDCCVAFSKRIQKFTIMDLQETRPEVKFVLLEKFI